MNLKLSFLAIVFLPMMVFSQAINRIVSLAPSLTMNIYYLDSKQKIVGCTSYCEIAKPDKKEIVGSATTVNIEKIVSLKPDLVVAHSITKPEVIDKLRKMGLRVEIFNTPKSFDEICSQFLRLGIMIGKTEKAKSIIAQTKTRVETIKAKHKGKAALKIFFQIGADPLFTVMTNTFMNDYMLLCGGTNIAADLKAGSIGRETVLKRNPDAIFIVTMGIAGNEEKAIWQKYNQLSAAKRKQIFIIDSNQACTPTPLSFIATLETIDKLLFPPKTKK